MSCQKGPKENIFLEVSQAIGKCSIGEKVGKSNLEMKEIPVLSCEGACIKGEISRLVANNLSKVAGYKRGCHGELFTVPGSSIAKWINESDKVVCIDGCFLKCHYRILQNIIPKEKILSFDTLSYHNRYHDIFDIDDVNEDERKSIAKEVFEKIRIDLTTGKMTSHDINFPAGCT